jgi:hypothetical protein
VSETARSTIMIDTRSIEITSEYPSSRCISRSNRFRIVVS